MYLKQEAAHCRYPQQWQQQMVRFPHAASDEIPVLKKNGRFAGQGEPLQADQAAHLYGDVCTGYDREGGVACFSSCWWRWKGSGAYILAWTSRVDLMDAK